MGLFSLFSLGMVKERADIVNNLAEELDADYYFGTSNIKDNFNVKWGHIDETRGNIITGTYKGYDYYVNEFAMLTTKYSRSYSWELETRVVIKSKKELPDFTLVSRTETSEFAFKLVLMVPIMLCCPLIFAAMDTRGDNAFRAWALALVIIFFVGLILFIAVKLCDGTLAYYKYKINNQRFKEKFAIQSTASSKEIREIFSDKVCDEMVDNFHNLLQTNCIAVKGNCISDSDGDYVYGFKGKLSSSDFINSRLKRLLSVLRILEGEKADDNDFWSDEDSIQRFQGNIKTPEISSNNFLHKTDENIKSFNYNKEGFNVGSKKLLPDINNKIKVKNHKINKVKNKVKKLKSKH